MLNIHIISLTWGNINIRLFILNTPTVTVTLRRADMDATHCTVCLIQCEWQGLSTLMLMSHVMGMSHATLFRLTLRVLSAARWVCVDSVLYSVELFILMKLGSFHLHTPLHICKLDLWSYGALICLQRHFVRAAWAVSGALNLPHVRLCLTFYPAWSRNDSKWVFKCRGMSKMFFNHKLLHWGSQGHILFPWL